MIRAVLVVAALLGLTQQTPEVEDDYQRVDRMMAKDMHLCEWLRLYTDQGGTFEEDDKDRRNGWRWRTVCRGQEGF
ncbi:MAG: hypothetical protein EOP83_06600 [Verrucomicrobiaceae bacterium]|nr:MAG: hypothetical protein EOP83_06600 [Verrucomicrobiaceae bacterium]